ncbi:MAG: pyridoxamine 5'-phosphate oxidase family protein [Phototrophicaceae bacterium]
MQFMNVADFSEIVEEFDARVRDMVWCSAATVDAQGRPRTRVLHPVWEGATGWIGTSPLSIKAKHLAIQPNLSLAYIKHPFKPVYVDCTVEWIEEMAEKRRIWDLFKSLPEPYGYDPVLAFPSVEHESFGVLKLTPWRIEVYSLGVESKIWKLEN